MESIPEFFRPVHAQVAVHPAGQHHLFLRRVPERIVGFRVLELFFVVDLFPWITEMQTQASVGPRFARVEAAIARIIPDKIHRELASNDQLFEKCFLIRRGRIGVFNREGYRQRVDLAKMQVRRKLARAFEVGLIAPGRISRKPVTEEAPKDLSRGRGAPSKSRYWSHRAVEWNLVQKVYRWNEGGDSAPPLYLSDAIRRWLQKLRQKRMDFRPNRTRRIMFLAEQPRWHNDIRVHRPEWHPQLCRNSRFSSFSATQRIFIADHQAGIDFSAKSQNIFLRIGAQNEANVPLLQGAGQLPQAAQHKLVVTQVGVVRARRELEKCHYRFSQRIAHPDGDIQRGIVGGALGPLHPVNDARAIQVERARSAAENARVKPELFKICHKLFVHQPSVS